MPNKKNVVCPICSRKFVTQAALAQHEAGAHKKVRRPKRPSPKVSDSRLRTMRAYGTDLASSVTLSVSGSFVGKQVTMVPISPSGFPDTRFAQEAALWCRWRPRSLKVHVDMAGASTTFGQLTIGWSPDPTPDFSARLGFENVKRVMSFKPHRIVKLSERTVFPIPTETSRRWLQTNGDIDQCAQGTLVIVVTAAIGGFSGFLTGNISLEWDVEFEGPEPLPPSMAPGEVAIKPDVGWSNLFTTSDGSFDATLLTFKMHHGGDMCPWSSARLGIIYGPTQSTVVPYVDSAGNTKKCVYFTRIAEYKIPGMLLFATYEDARKYVTSGSLDSALKYHAGGSECTPAIPMLKPVTAASLEDDKFAQMEQTIEYLTARLAAMEGLASEVVDNSAQAIRMRSHIEKISTRGTEEDPYAVAPNIGGNPLNPVFVAPVGVGSSRASTPTSPFETLEAGADALLKHISRLP